MTQPTSGQEAQPPAARPGIAAVTLGLAVGIAALTGCAKLQAVPTEHIVMVNGRGNPVDPTGNLGCADEPALCQGYHFRLAPYRELDRLRYDTYLTGLFDKMVQEVPVVNGKRRVLIFVHGGLNTQQATIERALGLHEDIERAGYFPVFVNWDSSLFFSYVDHLLYVRKGKDVGLLGVPLAPFYLLEDVTRSIARAPVVWSFQIWNDIRSMPVVRSPSQTDARRIADDVKTEGVIDLAEGKDDRRWPEMTLSFVTWLVTAPTKLLTAPFIDAFGKSAWDVMLRRTELLFHTDGEFGTESEVAKKAHRGDGYQHIEAHGGLSVFMRRFQEVIERHGGAGAWEVTLVGHSMGTIVVNQMLRQYGELGAGVMPFTRIVYMAAAARVDDYESSVFPYLKKNPEAHVYHLTLHARAEVRDRWEPIRFFDPPPRGSLLVWIDEFLSKPMAPRERTVGRFTNLLPALHDTPEPLRRRIHVKEFSAGADLRDTHPQKHGDFTSRFTFWLEDCWKPRVPSGPACSQIR